MVTQEVKPDIKIYPMVIATNHNNKLSCDHFIILQVAKMNGIPESVAEKTIFNISTKDNSHPPVNAKVIDSIRQPLKEISSLLTWLSHEMPRDTFINKLLEQPKINLDTEMVAYIYQRLPQLD